MLGKQKISAGEAVRFQLDEHDTEHQGIGVIKEVTNSIAEIVPNSGATSIGTLHRYISGNKLVVKNPHKS